MSTSSETLVADADLTPLQWIVDGTANNFTAVESVGDARVIQVQDSGLEDRLGLSTPAGDIGRSTSFSATVTVSLAFGAGASQWGVSVGLYSGVTFIGSGLTGHVSTVFSATEFVVNITGFSISEADSADLRMALVSYGTGWSFGQAFVQLDKVNGLLTYTDPIMTVPPENLTNTITATESVSSTIDTGCTLINTIDTGGTVT